MALLLNRAKAATATTGTGIVTLGGGVVPYRSWAAAGAVTTKWYPYLIEDGNDWEIGVGQYTSGAETLTRFMDASSTGALLNLSGAATVACVARDVDLRPPVVTAINGADQAIAVTSAVVLDLASIESPGSDPWGFADFVNNRYVIPANKGINHIRLHLWCQCTTTITKGSNVAVYINQTGVGNWGGDMAEAGYTNHIGSCVTPILPAFPGQIFTAQIQSADTSYSVDFTRFQLEVID